VRELVSRVTAQEHQVTEEKASLVIQEGENSGAIEMVWSELLWAEMVWAGVNLAV
jgi:hypothetical protein